MKTAIAIFMIALIFCDQLRAAAYMYVEQTPHSKAPQLEKSTVCSRYSRAKPAPMLKIAELRSVKSYTGSYQLTFKNDNSRGLETFVHFFSSNAECNKSLLRILK